MCRSLTANSTVMRPVMRLPQSDGQNSVEPMSQSRTNLYRPPLSLKSVTTTLLLQHIRSHTGWKVVAGCKEHSAYNYEVDGI